MANKALLLQELAFISGLPTKDTVRRDRQGNPTENYWNQGRWFLTANGCGSAGCFAGYTVLHAGGKFSCYNGVFVYADSLPEHVAASLEDRGSIIGGEADTSEAAAVLLDLTEDQAEDLFAASNTIERLAELIEEFTRPRLSAVALAGTSE